MHIYQLFALIHWSSWLCIGESFISTRMQSFTSSHGSFMPTIFVITAAEKSWSMMATDMKD